MPLSTVGVSTKPKKFINFNNLKHFFHNLSVENYNYD
jgi:hypothetical protein